MPVYQLSVQIITNSELCLKPVITYNRILFDHHFHTCEADARRRGVSYTAVLGAKTDY